MSLQDLDLRTMLGQIGRNSPSISGSTGYRAVMMAVESNLRVDGAEQLRSRMAFNRSSLRTRFDMAMKSLRREGPS